MFEYLFGGTMYIYIFYFFLMCTDSSSEQSPKLSSLCESKILVKIPKLPISNL